MSAQRTPTELRFDDLDLCEEPARGDAEQPDYLSNNTVACGPSTECTRHCCPPIK